MIRSTLIICTLIFCSSSLHSQWEFVGNPDGFSAYNLIRGKLKIQSNTGIPHVFYQNSTINLASEISMQRFNGTEWEYAGDQVIDNLMTFNDHLDFAFDPTNANIPIIYFHNGEVGPSSVAKLNGNTWEPLLGLSNFSFNLGSYLPTEPINDPNTFGFDVGPTGNPVIGFSDFDCINEGFGNPPGNMSVITHDGEEWQYLGQSCLSPRSAGSVDLEYSPVTNELFGYHKGGLEESKFDQFRILTELNGSQWDDATSPAFDLPNVVGRMSINPVTGNVFMYDWGYSNGIGSERQFKVYEWDGDQLNSLHENGDLSMENSNWLTAFHPITGEMYILFNGPSLSEDGALNIKKYDGTGWVETPFSDISGLQDQSIDFVDMCFDTNGDLYILRGRDAIAKVIKRDGNITDNVSQFTAESIELQIYPNPASREVNINFNTKSDVEISLINALGQTVFNTKLQAPQLKINTESLSRGLYSLRFEMDGQFLVENLVVE